MTLRRIFSEVQLSFGEVKDFFEKVVEASQVGQDAVDALVWPVLVDENFRGRFENALYVYTWCSEIRVSVFTAPVLDRECVETIFEGAVEKAHFNAIEVYLLLEREDFDDELFANVVKRMRRNSIVGAVLFLDDLKSKNLLTLGRLFEVYYLSEKEESLRQHRRVVFADGGVEEVASVRGYILNEIYSHYSDMPKTWVRQMLKSLKS